MQIAGKNERLWAPVRESWSTLAVSFLWMVISLRQHDHFGLMLASLGVVLAAALYLRASLRNKRQSQG